MTNQRPTQAQARVLTRLAHEGGRILQPLVSGRASRLMCAERGYLLVGTPTVRALIREGWITQSDGTLAGVSLVHRITATGRAEVAIAGGARRVAWPCSECKVLQPIAVRMYREMQREGSGILCRECWVPAMTAAPSTGEEGRAG